MEVTEEQLSAISEKIRSSFTELQSGRFDESSQLANEALAETRAFVHDNNTSLLVLEAQALNQLGNLDTARGDFASALQNYTHALQIAEHDWDSQLHVGCLCNIGTVYSKMEEVDESTSYYQQALKIAQAAGHRQYEANILCNLAGAFMSKGEWDNALQTFHQSLEAYTQANDAHGMTLVTGNIGALLAEQRKFDEAVPYLEQALARAEELGDKMRIMLFLDSLGHIYCDPDYHAKDTDLAEKHLLRALAISQELNSKFDRTFVLASLSNFYKVQRQFEKALDYYEQFHLLDQEMRSTEVKELADKLGYERKVAQREREVEVQRTLTHTTRQLLHRVLPESIAERMIDSQNEIADYFPLVSILFADIKGFTSLTATMPAHMVVRLLNHVFSTFDNIIHKHGCEKIKTIGDGYMAVAGAPEPCEDNAERLLSAAFEIRDTLHAPPGFEEYFTDGNSLGIRIGMHCGPVVAGVVGQQRFVYDVYSDAVNTASRMESHGETGKIHVTSEFVQHLQQRHITTNNTTHGINFILRGDVDIKGKGIMTTYFVERA